MSVYIDKTKIDLIAEKFLEMDFINKNLEKSLFKTNERTVRTAIKKVYELSGHNKFFINIKRPKERGLYQSIDEASQEDIQRYFGEQMSHITKLFFDVIMPLRKYLRKEQQEYLYGFVDLFTDFAEREAEHGNQE